MPWGLDDAGEIASAPQTLCFRRDDRPRIRLDVDPLTRSEEEESEKLEPPCRVIIHNDDVTPFEYVASLLHQVFALGWFKALRITLAAHVMGDALVVVEPCDHARAHVVLAHDTARLEGHPHLHFSVEPTEE